MTSTRYVDTLHFNRGVIILTDDDWADFQKSISEGCTFIVHNGGGVDATKQHAICHFQARYYVINGSSHYHVSNDDRRKIVRYLRDYSYKV
jgi:hypothetical protein